MARELNSQEFESFITENKVALVDFSAAWCGPCKQLKPILNQISESRDGVAVVDVDQSPDLAMRFGVNSVPTMVFFKDGQPVDQLIGLVPSQAIEKKLEALSA